ncbi:hypothetical protein B0O80DRAFT_454951 [Mortierella sp. GBAus27b]|nr:hypothetical protein B0O80DRAFT_454951 [Mortierella sp. GBAus27b]
MQQQQEQQEDDNHGVNAVQDDAAMNDTAAAMSMSCGIVESVAKLYQQIGRLTQLEILDLRYNSIGDPNSVDFMGDLTLAGGLSFLSELKSLRQLVLISDLWTGMGQAEVEFMAECWPRLEVIAFGTSARIQDWNTPTFDHWRWLEKRILGLRLVFLEDDEKVWND